MRNLDEIIEDCKLNKKPTVDELRYAVIALTSIANLMQSSLMDIYRRTDNSFTKIRIENAYNAYSTALNKSPKEWLGWNNDPENPEYQRFHTIGSKLIEGQATYHYDINPYWDMFRVRELEKAPEWDGHTSEQAIERIAGLTREAAEKVIPTCNVTKLPCAGCNPVCEHREE